MEIKNSTILVVDGNSFSHKFFHGYEPCLDKNGNDQRILYGFMHFLNSIGNEVDELNYLFLIFDGDDGALYRKSIFPAYKANRPPKDVDFEIQKNHAIKILREKLGVPLLQYNSYEADDVMASIASFFKKDNKVIIVSPDKDLFQTVDNNVHILRPVKYKNNKKYEFIDVDGVFKTFGVSPKLIPDLLALTGDVADNLPGVNKVGVKTASKLLHKYLSLEHIVSFAHEIDGVIGESIRNDLEFLLTVKNLATVIDNLPIEKEIYATISNSIDIQKDINYSHCIEELKSFYSWKSWFTNVFLDS